MPHFSYKAVDDTGKTIKGVLRAEDENHLFGQLRETGLRLVRCAPMRQRRQSTLFAPNIRSRDLIQLCLHLQQMNAAGVPLLESLTAVKDSTEHPRLEAILKDVVRDVSEGSSLSEAFTKHPKQFSHVFTALVAAGEESGNLTDSFAELVKHYKWVDEVNRKIKKATRYPLFMLFVMFALFYFMMRFVVPEVVSFLAASGQVLPPVTRSLVATSSFVENYSLLILAFPFIVFGLFKLARLSDSMAYHMDAFFLRIPLVGTTARKIALSRFSHFFATMFSSGVTILDGLSTARRVVVNRYLARALDLVREAVQSGESLSSALERWGDFPPLVVRMVKIGEDSGQLSETLGNVTDFYDREVEETVDQMISFVEPTLTLSAGLMMGWIVFGVIGPIYDSFENLGL